MNEYPEDLQSKVYLVKHFERYIMDRLYGNYAYTYVDEDLTRNMAFVQKYLRMNKVIVFKLSHDAIQFNFYDHSKVVLSEGGLVITHIDKNYDLRKWSLAEIMEKSLMPPDKDRDEAKMNQRLLEKAKYCRDVLVMIVNAAQEQEAQSSPTTATAQKAESEPEQHHEQRHEMRTAQSTTGLRALTSRASKMSLR